MSSFEEMFLATFLEEAIDIMADWERICLKLAENFNQDDCLALFRAAHNLKGSSRSVGLDDLSSFVHHIEDFLQALRNGKLTCSPAIIELLLRCHSTMSEWLLIIPKNKAFIPVDVQVIRNEITDFSIGMEPERKAEAVDFALEDKTAKPAEIDQTGIAFFDKTKKGQQTSEKGKNTNRGNEVIRVSAAKLDSLIQLIGELTSNMAMVHHSYQSSVHNVEVETKVVDQCYKITKEMQSAALSLRMQSLGGLFQRLERASRDVAITTKKAINVEMTGAEVELDKTVIERITEPLVHIVRNAVDHGVETSDRRIEAGKPAAATIKVIGIQDANGVTIQISDDGRGLDAERIERKARDLGLIKVEGHLTSRQIHQLILLPGFSTAEKVTDISGRGVGMDIVNRSVSEIGGVLAIESEPGKGTTFSISLPTSLSILDALILRVDGSLYSVPIQDLAEVVDLASFKVESSTEKGKMIDLRGTIVPVQNLSVYLPKVKGWITEEKHEGIEIKGQGWEGSLSAGGRTVIRRRPTIVTQIDSQLLAFEVDQIIGQASIVVRHLEGQLASQPGITGATLLGDGEPAMIINLKQISKTFLLSTMQEVKKHG